MSGFQKRVFNLHTFWEAANAAFRTIFDLKRYTGETAVDARFSERIMLAVTQVNGCRYCSFGHTKAALNAGVPIEEIRGLLSGELNHAPEEEIPALVFAQHYAETAGHPEPQSWQNILDIYGAHSALKILAAIRMITLGNLLGNTFDALIARITGKPAAPESSFFQELGVLVGAIFILPAALIRQRFRTPRNASPAAQLDG